MLTFAEFKTIKATQVRIAAAIVPAIGFWRIVGRIVLAGVCGTKSRFYPEKPGQDSAK